jgi:hypothetical protein
MLTALDFYVQIIVTQKNTEIRDFIQQNFKHEEVKQVKGFEDIRLEKFSTLAQIVWKCWDG